MILVSFRRGFILGSALALGVGLASWQNAALAGVSDPCPLLTNEARASGLIVVAENDGETTTTRNTVRVRTLTETRMGITGTARAAGTTVIEMAELTTDNEAAGASTAPRVTMTATATMVTGRAEATGTANRISMATGVTMTAEVGTRMATSVGAGTTKITGMGGAATTTIGIGTGIGAPMCETGIASLTMASSLAASFWDRFWRPTA